jgi:hypothetical protein
MMEEHGIAIAQACSGRMEMMEGLGGGRPGRPMPSFWVNGWMLGMLHAKCKMQKKHK